MSNEDTPAYWKKRFWQLFGMVSMHDRDLFVKQFLLEEDE